MVLLKEIEALLFVVGEEGLTLDEMSHILDQSTSTVYDQLLVLREVLEQDENSGITILEVGDSFVLTTKKELSPLLKNFAQSAINQRLSQAALETLAIIAYRQPITRVEIEHIRGVQSSGSIQKLVHRQLIQEKGRVDGPGRAIMYGTTPYFYDYFGLKTMADLPDINELEEEAEEEEIPTDLFFDAFKEQFDEIEKNKKKEDG